MTLVLAWGACYVISLIILDTHPFTRHLRRRMMALTPKTSTAYDAILLKFLAGTIIIMTDATALFLAAYETIQGHPERIPAYIYLVIGVSLEFGFSTFRVAFSIPGLPPVTTGGN